MIIGLWGTGEQAVSYDGMWRRNHTHTPHWIGAPKRKKIRKTQILKRGSADTYAIVLMAPGDLTPLY